MLSNFVLENAKRFRLVFDGCTFTSKLRLFSMALVQSVPNLVRRQFKLLDVTLNDVANSFCYNVWIKANGLRFHVVDCCSLGIVHDEFEPFMQQYFKPKAGEVVLDVGANVGKYTLESARAVGKFGFVVAVEPDVKNYSCLLKALKVNGFSNVYSIRSVAGDFNGYLKLFSGVHSGGHNIICDQGKGAVEVKCLMLDDLVKNLKLSRLDWVKVDVEGAELSVLRGLSNSLLTFKPRLIVEVWDSNRKNILGLLGRLNFECLEVERMDVYNDKTKTLVGYSYFYCYPMTDSA